MSSDEDIPSINCFPVSQPVQSRQRRRGRNSNYQVSVQALTQRLLAERLEEQKITEEIKNQVEAEGKSSQDEGHSEAIENFIESDEEEDDPGIEIFQLDKLTFFNATLTPQDCGYTNENENVSNLERKVLNKKPYLFCSKQNHIFLRSLTVVNLQSFVRFLLRTMAVAEELRYTKAYGAAIINIVNSHNDFFVLSSMEVYELILNYGVDLEGDICDLMPNISRLKIKSIVTNNISEVPFKNIKFLLRTLTDIIPLCQIEDTDLQDIIWLLLLINYDRNIISSDIEIDICKFIQVSLERISKKMWQSKVMELARLGNLLSSGMLLNIMKVIPDFTMRGWVLQKNMAMFFLFKFLNIEDVPAEFKMRNFLALIQKLQDIDVKDFNTVIELIDVCIGHQPVFDSLDDARKLVASLECYGKKKIPIHLKAKEHIMRIVCRLNMLLPPEMSLKTVTVPTVKQQNNDICADVHSTPEQIKNNEYMEIIEDCIPVINNKKSVHFLSRKDEIYEKLQSSLPASPISLLKPSASDISGCDESIRNLRSSSEGEKYVNILQESCNRDNDELNHDPTMSEMMDILESHAGPISVLKPFANEISECDESIRNSRSSSEDEKYLKTLQESCNRDAIDCDADELDPNPIMSEMMDIDLPACLNRSAIQKIVPENSSSEFVDTKTNRMLQTSEKNEYSEVQEADFAINDANSTEHISCFENPKIATADLVTSSPTKVEANSNALNLTGLESTTCLEPTTGLEPTTVLESIVTGRLAVNTVKREPSKRKALQPENVIVKKVLITPVPIMSTKEVKREHKSPVKELENVNKRMRISPAAKENSLLSQVAMSANDGESQQTIEIESDNDDCVIITDKECTIITDYECTIITDYECTILTDDEHSIIADDDCVFLGVKRNHPEVININESDEEAECSIINLLI